MHRIVGPAVLALLAGCPAAPPPVIEEPPPPPVATVDAAPEPPPPEPVVPAVLAVRSGDGALELVRVDVAGETRVLHALRRGRGSANVADLAVDAASGRYAVLVEADDVDGAATGTPRNVMTLVLGDLDGGTIAAGPADPRCVMHRCFESAIAIAPGGDTVVTTQHRASASDLARYEVAAAARPTRLTAKSVEKPTLSADHARLAFLRRGAIYVGAVDAAGGADPPAKVASGLRDVAALALGDAHLVYRTRAGALVVVDLATLAASTAARLAIDPRPPLRLAGGEILTTDGASVVAVPLAGGAPRTIASGALIDVSADGAWLLIDDGALSVVASDGRVATRLDLPPALGPVHARLAP